ncbi:MAG: hypothetical protein DRI90_26520 [Deltaproteobacteria bacterium]|nr:MAG: hypothetical protein DRI90_26520 [Deltaproteobacteria bacterium]
MVDATPAREIERSISTALARKGIAGTVVLRGTTVELHGSGPAVIAIDVSDWVDQWQLLPPEMCDRRAELAADRLSRAASGSRPPPALPGRTWETIKKTLAVLVVLAIAGAVVFWLRQAGFFGQSVPSGGAGGAASGATVETVAGAKARTERACEAARRRIYAGASMGIDVEGWVVELWLARPADQGDLAADPKLAARLRALPGDLEPAGPAEATVARDTATRLGAASAIVQLNGGYVASFFDVEGRKRLQQWVGSAAAAVGAHYAALSARCDHLSTHDVGAWYAGPDETAVWVALLYDAGLFASPPAFDLDVIDARTGTLPGLRSGAVKFDAAAAAELLRQLGGRMELVPPAGGGVALTTLSFPLGGPTRATKAAREIAGQLLAQ